MIATDRESAATVHRCPGDLSQQEIRASDQLALLLHAKAAMVHVAHVDAARDKLPLATRHLIDQARILRDDVRIDGRRRAQIQCVEHPDSFGRRRSEAHNRGC